MIHSFSFNDHLSIFEIYPQSEIPLLTQIAHVLFFSVLEYPAYLLPDILICMSIRGRIAFRVVDHRKNYSTCFSPDLDFDCPFDVFFVLSKMSKLASNNLLGRQSRQRPLLSSSVMKEC